MFQLTLALLAAAPTAPLVLPRPEEPTRTEYFVLEERRSEGNDPVAVLALRRVPLEDGVLLEQEIFFRAAGLRVLTDETHRGDEVRLVWRELRSSPETGRTWMVEWDGAAHSLTTASHGTRSKVHGSLAGPCPEFPLALIESLRTQDRSGTISTLDPLARGLETLEVRTDVEGETRVVSLTREDGSFAGRYRFEGTSLVELQLQGGARVARPCTRAEYQRLSAHWCVSYDPLRDLRAWSRRPKVRAR